jgi:polyribonucleotide nucleotidyltransferase
MEGPEITAAETVIDNGRFGQRTIRFETGLLAQQAAGSVAAYLDDDTMLLSATTAGKHPKDHFDFFPLTVDVEERMYAAGRIPGSFFRREGRPSEDAILTCRLIDRPLRPTFMKGLRNEVQVVITVLSLNPDSRYDVLAINAASASTCPGCRSPGRSAPPGWPSSTASGSASRPMRRSSSRCSTWSSPAVSPPRATSRS